MKTTTIALLIAITALGWGAYTYRRMRQLSERLENSRSSQFRFADQAREQIEALETELRSVKNQLRAAQGGGLYYADMTMEEALNLDPRVQQVLGGFHIGGCDSCAVSPDETLERAAMLNNQDPDKVLTALNKLDSPEADTLIQQLERRPNVQIQL